MTQATDTSPSVTEAEKLVVEQCDREAFAAMARIQGGPPVDVGYVLMGQADDHPGVQSYAAHRLAERDRLTLPVDETELVERMAKEHAFARRSQHDMARDADHYWQNTSQETQAVEIKAATAALSIVRPHLSEIERLRGALDLAANRLSRCAVEAVGTNLQYEWAEWTDEARQAARISGRG